MIALGEVDAIRIERLRDHFIVCGFGQAGRTLVDQLTRATR